MSYPYHQYVDFSAPPTPRVYTWEVEQDSLQLPAQPQHVLQAFQEQPQQHHHQQQHHVQQQQEQQQQPQVVYEPPPTIQLQERKPPSQFRFDNITEEHFIQAAASASSDEPAGRRRGASKLPLHVNTTLRTSTVSPGASSAGAGPSATSMPQRVPHARHAHSVHPYRRLPGAGPGASAQRVHRENEMRQHPLQTQSGGASSSSMPAPDVLSGMATQCPAADSWRETLLSHDGHAASTTSPDAGSPPRVQTPTAHAQGQGHAQPHLQAGPPRRYAIRTDVHYDADEHVMTAMLELPGLKKSDLCLTLAFCPYSRVRQLTVAGTSRPTLPARGHAVRERKFGAFARTIIVPPDTKPEDVVAMMEDGILTLKIPSGLPMEPEQPQDITVQ